MKKTFTSFDLGIDHLFPTEPEERKQKKEERLSTALASNLDHLVEGVQAKTTKYKLSTKYAVNVIKVIFAFNYYNKILKITLCFFTKMYNKIKRELYATDCECFEIKFYTADRLQCFGCQMFKKMTI